MIAPEQLYALAGVWITGVVFVLAGDYSGIPAFVPTGDEVLPVGYIGPILMVGPLMIAEYLETRELRA